MEQILNTLVDKYKNEMIDKIAEFVRLETVNDQSTATEGAPYGKANREALDKFIAMREKEGENLRADLLAKKAELVSMVDCVEGYAANYTENYRQKLENRLRTVLADLDVTADEGRILTECAIFADKTAVSDGQVIDGTAFIPIILISRQADHEGAGTILN